MRTERLQKLEEMAADLLGTGSRPEAEPMQQTSVGPHTPPSQDMGSAAAPEVETKEIEAEAVEAEAELEMTISGRPDELLTGLDLDTTIRLRWVLRDIDGKRTKMSLLAPDDLRILVERGLVAMQDDAPVLTDEGRRALV